MVQKNYRTLCEGFLNLEIEETERLSSPQRQRWTESQNWVLRFSVKRKIGRASFYFVKDSTFSLSERKTNAFAVRELNWEILSIKNIFRFTSGLCIYWLLTNTYMQVLSSYAFSVVITCLIWIFFRKRRELKFCSLSRILFFDSVKTDRVFIIILNERKAKIVTCRSRFLHVCYQFLTECSLLLLWIKTCKKQPHTLMLPKFQYYKCGGYQYYLVHIFLIGITSYTK